MLCAFSLLPYYVNRWLQPPRGVKRYNSHWFFSLQWDLLSIVLCVRNTGWTRQTRSTISWNVNSGKVVTHKRQIYKDGLRLLNVMRKIKHKTGCCNKTGARSHWKTKEDFWRRWSPKPENMNGRTMQSSGEEHSRQREQLVPRREGRTKPDMSGGRNLDKSGQCS